MVRKKNLPFIKYRLIVAVELICKYCTCFSLETLELSNIYHNENTFEHLTLSVISRTEKLATQSKIKINTELLFVLN